MGLQGCSQKTIMTEAKSMVRFSSDEKNNNNNKNRKNKF